ncbi:hypothetical protein, partial [Escherichia coli]|uniref:hypothetical protein n=1 Tax=Escherichia coli TaxID=562 RepID=UPI002074C56B
MRPQVMNNCLFARHTLAPFSPNLALISAIFASASSRQPGGCGLSWPEITVIKTDNIIVFQVVICPVQLNPVNENL